MKNGFLLPLGYRVKCETNNTGLSSKKVSTGQDKGVTTDLKGLMVKWFPIRSREKLRVPQARL